MLLNLLDVVYALDDSLNEEGRLLELNVGSVRYAGPQQWGCPRFPDTDLGAFPWWGRVGKDVLDGHE